MMSAANGNAQVTNRYELLQLLGATRGDDGSFKLREPCPDCGAERLNIEWDKSAGIDATIHHLSESDEGCTLTTAEVALPPRSSVARAVN